MQLILFPHGFVLLSIGFDKVYELHFVGRADLSELLTNIDDRITEARELALSRKDILEKVEKWTLATEEEGWLGEYERVT